jgi:hypothetical protein
MLEDPQNHHHQNQLLYLRGCYCLSVGDVVGGFGDFDAVLKADATVFPQNLILNILNVVFF